MRAATYVRASLVATSIFLLPLLASAGTVPGGFPSGSVWVSKTAPVAGDSIQVYVPIFDASNGKITGDVVFLVDDATIGSTHFTLEPGEAKIASFPWSAKEGSHTVSAKIQDAVDTDSKASLSLSGENAQGAIVAVAPPPPQPAIVQALSTAANVAQDAVSASVPMVIAAADAIHGSAEAFRTTAQSALQKSLGQDAEGQDGEVLGASIYRPSQDDTAAAANAFSPSSVVRTLERGALFIVSYQWVFYPLLILLILTVFYLGARRLSRPRSERT